MTTATITEMMEKKSLVSRVDEQLAKVSWVNVAYGSGSMIGVGTFGFYGYIFAAAGGGWWLMAIPYFALAGVCAGFTVYCFRNISNKSLLW